MTCAIPGAEGDEKAPGTWICYLATFETPAYCTIYIIMCQLPFLQDLYPNLKAMLPGGEMFYILFSRNILLISAMFMKNNMLTSMVSSILIVSWMLVSILSTAKF
ncbi:MAG: hypothetical protein GY756_09055 [bacterium]|nr:hypothetical protein [bacterium]